MLDEELLEKPKCGRKCAKMENASGALVLVDITMPVTILVIECLTKGKTWFWQSVQMDHHIGKKCKCVVSRPIKQYICVMLFILNCKIFFYNEFLYFFSYNQFNKAHHKGNRCEGEVDYYNT